MPESLEQRLAKVRLVHPKEVLAAGAFVLFLCLCVGGASYILAGWWEGTISSPLAAVAAVVLAFMVLGFLWGRIVEPRFIETKHLAIRTAKRLPRLVFLSDLHVEGRWRTGDSLAEKLRAIAPEAILMGGDYLNAGDCRTRETLEKLLDSLSELAPMVAVLGNADAAYPDLPSVLENRGVCVLDNGRSLELPGGAVVWGVGFVDESALADAASKLDHSRFNICLTHEPSLFPAAAKAGFNLFLAGHTHGGQVRLPFYGALVTLAVLGKRFEAGRYELDGAVAYVSRGVGLEGGRFVPRVRFLCRPEILVITGETL